jgi:mRNA interferase RelE/StbE
MAVSVTLTPEALQQLATLPPSIIGRMAKLLERLSKWPDVSGAKPLSAELTGRYRLRTGDYRLQFYVANDAVIVEKIGHRDGFYGE